MIGETKIVHFTASIDDKETVYEKSYRWLKKHPNVYDVVYADIFNFPEEDILIVEYTEVEEWFMNR